VRPPVAGVLPADHHPRAGGTRGPHIIRVDLEDIPLDCLGAAEQRGIRCLDRRLNRRLIQPDLRIGVKMRDIGPFCQHLRGVQPAAHPHHVGHPERLPLDAEPGQRPPQGRLRALGMFRQGPVDVFALLRLAAQRSRGAQIRLVREEHDELGPSIRGILQHPRIDLGVPRRRGRSSGGDVCARRCRNQRGQRGQRDEEEQSSKHGVSGESVCLMILAHPARIFASARPAEGTVQRSVVCFGFVSSLC